MHFLQINNGNDDYSKKSNFQKEINNCDYFQNNNIEEYNIQIEPYLLNINNNYCNINKNNNEILLENDYNLLFFENNEYYDNINNKNFLDINDNKNSESLNLKINYNTNNNTNYGRQQYNQNYKNFPFLDLDNTRSISKPNIINNLKSNFHDYKEELNFNLLEIYEPNIINDDRINKQNLINNEYDYSCISNKILFLKKDLEKSLIYTVQNYGVGSYNIKLIDDIKDLICQIDLVLQKFTSQDYISQNKNNVKTNSNNIEKKKKRIPKTWKMSTSKINSNKIHIEKDKTNEKSYQQLKKKEKKEKKEFENFNNKTDINKEKINIKESKTTISEHSLNNNIDNINKLPMIVNITNKKSRTLTDRRYHIDFNNFYTLIEKAQEMLHTMNKYEKTQHDQHYQFLYKMCDTN